MSKSPTIKNVCESMIQSGTSHANILYELKEQFGRNAQDMAKRIRHYAGALYRDGHITKERKSQYIGDSGIGQKTLDKREYMLATAKRRKNAVKAKARHKRNNPKYR